MVAILNSAMFKSTILDSGILVISSQNHSHLSRLDATICTKETPLIHSHSTWWWQPSWIWPSWIHPSEYILSNSLTLAKIGFPPFAEKNFTHSFWFNLMKAAILNSAILQKPNFTYSFSLNLLMAVILNSAILDSAILHKKKLHSFIVTQLDDGSYLEFCHVGFWLCHLQFRHLVIFSQIHSKTPSLHSDSDSN